MPDRLEAAAVDLRRIIDKRKKNPTRKLLEAYLNIVKEQAYYENKESVAKLIRDVIKLKGEDFISKATDIAKQHLYLLLNQQSPVTIQQPSPVGVAHTMNLNICDWCNDLCEGWHKCSCGRRVHNLCCQAAKLGVEIFICKACKLQFN